MTKHIALTVALCLSVGVVSAEWVAAAGGRGGARVEILDQSASGTTFEIVVPGVETSTRHVNGQEFTVLDLPSSGPAPLEEGRPQVPLVTVLLARPGGSDVSARILGKTTERFDVETVYPLQSKIPVGSRAGALAFDRDAYARTQVYPVDDFSVAHSAKWGDLDVFCVHVYPVRVEPGGHYVEVASRIRIRVEYSSGTYPREVSSWMVPIYSKTVANFAQLGVGTRDVGDEAIDYVVICPPEYRSLPALAELLNWVHQRGYRYVIPDIMSYDQLSIKAAITACYLNPDNDVRWVLLVGDAGAVPLAKYPNPYYNPELRPLEPPMREGDFWYSDLLAIADIDYYPEVGIARLSLEEGNEEQDLANQVSKILAYQKAPFSMASGSPLEWLNRIQLVAQRDAPPGPTRPAMDLIANLTLDYHVFDRPILDGEEAGTGNEEVQAALEQPGCGSLIYFGHGSPLCWANWTDEPPGSWSKENIEDTENGTMTPVVLNWACYCGDIDYMMEALVESWMRQYDDDERGAVATLGNVHLRYEWPGWSPSLEQYAYALGSSEHPVSGGGHTYPDPVFNLGDVKMMMDACEANEGGNDRRANVLSCLALGDPSMPIWSGGQPCTPAVDYPVVVEPGTQKIPVTVYVEGRPVEDALVCLVHEPEVYARGRTGPDGYVELDVDIPAGMEGKILVTVSEGHAEHSDPHAPHTPILPFVSGGWSERASLPEGERPVDRGGWLDYNVNNGLIYAAKGKKTGEFYCYNPAVDLWQQLASIPPSVRDKDPSRGCRGVCVSANDVYMTRGNNTQDFLRYEIGTNTWYELDTVPRGSNKVKDGADMVYVPGTAEGDFLYLLKGYRRDFYRYNLTTGSWETTWGGQAHPAPDGLNRRWKAGSFLVFDGDHTIYAHQSKYLAADYHALWRFDVLTGEWDYSNMLRGMPLAGVNKGRIKYEDARWGSSGAWLDGEMFALKGHRTQSFYKYTPGSNSWTELETIPGYGSTGRLKLVKQGGDITAANGVLYALKGYKTLEFWSYTPSIALQVSDGDGASLALGPQACTDVGVAVASELGACRPRWSQDGQWVTYHKEDGQGIHQVYVWEFDVPGSEVQLTFEPGDCENPVFSPDGQWVAFQMFDEASESYQICKVEHPAAGPMPIVQLTFDAYDHENPEWSPDGMWVVFQRDDATGFTQVYQIDAAGSFEMPLTSDDGDHEWPAFLTPTEVVYQWVPVWEEDQICKVDVVTLQMTQLTFSPNDHEYPAPCPENGSVAYQVFDDEGMQQIGVVSGSGGDELTLTCEDYDLEQPDWSQDGMSIFGVRWTYPGSEIGRVDAFGGGYTPLTDASAVRDHPDVYWDQFADENLVVFEQEDIGSGGSGGTDRQASPGVHWLRGGKSVGGVMAGIADRVVLHPVLPNPATERVLIRWQIPVATEVQLKVYNTAGRLVRTLADGHFTPGIYEAVWDGFDAQGRRLSNGIYFCTLESEDARLKRKLVLTE